MIFILIRSSKLCLTGFNADSKSRHVSWSRRLVKIFRETVCWSGQFCLRPISSRDFLPLDNELLEIYLLLYLQLPYLFQFCSLAKFEVELTLKLLEWNYQSNIGQRQDQGKHNIYLSQYNLDQFTQLYSSLPDTFLSHTQTSCNMQY